MILTSVRSCAVKQCLSLHLPMTSVLQRMLPPLKFWSDSVPQLNLFSLILWYRIFVLLGDHLATNGDEIVQNVMLRKHLTDTTHHLYVDIIGSVEYRRELRALFGVNELSEAYLSIGSMLCLQYIHFRHSFIT